MKAGSWSMPTAPTRASGAACHAHHRSPCRRVAGAAARRAQAAGPQELATRARQVEVVLPTSNQPTTEPDELHRPRPTTSREQRVVRERRTEERPPEQLGVEERAREHEPGEHADRQAQQSSTEQARPTDGADHHDHEQPDREQQRVAVRAVAERDVEQEREQRPDRDQAVVDAPALEDERDTGDRQADVPEEHAAASVGPKVSGRAPRSPARRRRCSARAERARGRRASKSSSSARACAWSGFRWGCFTFHRPASCSMTSFESARTCTVRGENARAASSPAMSALYSATLLVVTPMRSLTAASRVGGASTDRARPRRWPRPRVPARAAVAVDDDLVTAGRHDGVGHGTRMQPQLSQCEIVPTGAFLMRPPRWPGW